MTNLFNGVNPDTKVVSKELTTEEKIDQIHENMAQILKFVENINNQVQPLMDKVKNSPLGAMFGV